MTEYDHDPHYWVGRFSASIVMYLEEGDRGLLKEALDEFLRSPAPTEELKAELRSIRADAKRRRVSGRRKKL